MVLDDFTLSLTLSLRRVDLLLNGVGILSGDCLTPIFIGVTVPCRVGVSARVCVVLVSNREEVGDRS